MSGVLNSESIGLCLKLRFTFRFPRLSDQNKKNKFGITEPMMPGDLSFIIIVLDIMHFHSV